MGDSHREEKAAIEHAAACRTGEPEFDPAGYLREYYGHVGAENRALLAFHAQAHRLLPAGGLLLEFGGGPVIYPLIAAAPRVRAIHFAEHRADNREVVRRWLAGAPGAVDWTPFVRYGLAIERALEPAANTVGSAHEQFASDPPRACAPNRSCAVLSPATVAAREALIRRAVTRLLPCDAYRRHPLGYDARVRYDIVSMNFVAESIGDNQREWRGIMARVTDLVRPGGALIMTALLGARYYAIGARRLPATPLTTGQIAATLAGLGFTPLIARAIPAEHASSEREPDSALSWQRTGAPSGLPPLEGVAPKEDCRVACAGVTTAGTIRDGDAQEHGCHTYQGYAGIALYAGIRAVPCAPHLVRNRLTRA